MSSLIIKLLNQKVKRKPQKKRKNGTAKTEALFFVGATRGARAQARAPTV
jgi:hypothetical protein